MASKQEIVSQTLQADSPNVRWMIRRERARIKLGCLNCKSEDLLSGVCNTYSDTQRITLVEQGRDDCCGNPDKPCEQS